MAEAQKEFQRKLDEKCGVIQAGEKEMTRLNHRIETLEALIK